MDDISISYFHSLELCGYMRTQVYIDILIILKNEQCIRYFVTYYMHNMIFNFSSLFDKSSSI